MRKRKFELIKKYPGLHKDIKPGAIATEYFSPYEHKYYRIELADGDYSAFLPSDIEDHPEFWREFDWRKLEYVTTTEDGVDLYEKDNYYYYDLGSKNIFKAIILPEQRIDPDEELFTRRFSTYEAAKQDLENMLSTEADPKKDEEDKKEYYTKEDLRILVKFVGKVMHVGETLGNPIEVPFDNSAVHVFVDQYDEFKESIL